MPVELSFDATLVEAVTGKLLRPPKGSTVYNRFYVEDIIFYMSMGNTPTAYAGMIGVSKKTLDLWAKDNPEFAEAIDRGVAAAVRWWEIEHKAAAKEGRSTAAAAFALKNLAPKEWRDKTEINATLNVTVSQAEMINAIDRKFAKLIEHTPAAQYATGGQQGVDTGETRH